MGNYKEVRLSIKCANVEHKQRSGTVVFYLNDNVAAAAVADGMHDSETNAIYQSSTSKNFRLLGIKLHIGTSSAGDTVVISSGDTENAETGTKLTLKVPPISNSTIEYASEANFQGGKFITYNPANVSIEFIEMWGYEYDST